MQMLVAARHRPGTRYRQLYLPDWCTLVPYAGPGDTQELARCQGRERGDHVDWLAMAGLSVRSELGGVTTPGQCYIMAHHTMAGTHAETPGQTGH